MASFIKGESKVLAGTGNGVETYVYQSWDGNESSIKICIINTYLAKVDTVNEATAKKDRNVELKIRLIFLSVSK